MALQKTITGNAGLEMSYWRITNASFSFEGAPFNIQFNMEGYKDSNYRSSSNAGGSLSFRPALSRTGDADSYNTLADNVLANTKADIRPALYDWVKTQTGWVGGSADPSQSSTPINWSNATDV
jgi:hypothetical protein